MSAPSHPITANSPEIRDTRNFARAEMQILPNGAKIFLASVMVYDARRPDGSHWVAGFCTGWWPNRALARRIAKHWQILFERPDCGSEKWDADKAGLLEVTEKSRRIHTRDPLRGDRSSESIGRSAEGQRFISDRRTAGSAPQSGERADAAQIGGGNHGRV